MLCAYAWNQAFAKPSAVCATTKKLECQSFCPFMAVDTSLRIFEIRSVGCVSGKLFHQAQRMDDFNRQVPQPILQTKASCVVYSLGGWMSHHGQADSSPSAPIEPTKERLQGSSCSKVNLVMNNRPLHEDIKETQLRQPVDSLITFIYLLRS